MFSGWWRAASAVTLLPAEALDVRRRAFSRGNVGSTIAGIALCLIAAFMVLGFAQVGSFSIAALIALAIGAGIPGAAGAALLLDLKRKKHLTERRSALRRQTIESEILRLAARSENKLTVIEVVSDLAISPEEASSVLDSLAARELAELQVTDSGVLVYDFRDLRHLSEKDSATGLLDA